MDTNHLEQHLAPYFRSVLRIITGLLFLEFGTSKLFGFPSSGMEVDHFFSLIGLAGVLEFIGGLLIVLGLFTHVVAFILSGEMAVAYFMAHLPKGFFPVANDGTPAVLFCFVFLFLAVAGAGPWSLDHLHLFEKKKKTTTATRKKK